MRNINADVLLSRLQEMIIYCSEKPQISGKTSLLAVVDVVTELCADDKENKDKWVKIRCTESQHEYVREKALENNMTVSEYIRFLIDNDE
jgi:hypothetical protein